MLRASPIEDATYDLGRELKTFRIDSPQEAEQGGRRIHRSSAMAAGLTDHIREIEELLTMLPFQHPNNTRDYRRLISQ